MSQTQPATRRRVSPSLVISLLALFVAGSGTAYALGRGEVKTINLARGAVTTPKLAPDAVVSGKVLNQSLRLHDLGGPRAGTRPTDTELTIPPYSCRTVILIGLQQVKGLLGGLVIGSVTDADGNAVLDNDGVVVPTMVNQTTQGDPGETELNLLVCDGGGGGQTIPAGSVFHYRVIGS